MTDRPSQAVASVAEALLSQLTLREKAGLLAGDGFWKTRAVPRLGIRPLGMTDGPLGVAFHSSWRRATRYPAPVALAATFDEQLAEAFGAALGQETADAGKRMVLAPGVNIVRSPLGGRNFEYFGEDPWLASRLAVSVIRGIQSRGIAACVKHFVANNQETRRRSVSVEVDERTLREIYLPAFGAAVAEADVWAVMACYNRINGVYGCEHRPLLTDVLREELGFSNLVVSDWFAARPTGGTAACIRAGLSLEMPGPGRWLGRRKVLRAINRGELTEADVDRVLAGLLRTLALTGCIEGHAPAVEDRPRSDPEAVARQVAREGIVLLSNRDGILPLDVAALGRVAVVGPNADHRFGFPLAGGSSAAWPRREITPLAALRERLGSERIVGDPADADVALVFAGLRHRPGGDCEGFDRKQLSLPPRQEALIRKTAAANPRTVVVLLCGSPVAMPWLDQVAAVVLAWYPGMYGGDAIVDVLTGAFNPCGRLPVTFPGRLVDSPAHRSERTWPGSSAVEYAEGAMVGYRHFDAAALEPLFPFGYGLSYTRFDYRDLAFVVADESVIVTFTLANTGARAGAEVAQVYVGAPGLAVPRPPRELKRFARVVLQAGESKRVELEIPLATLRYYDHERFEWLLEEGEYRIAVGSSSRDLRLHGTCALPERELNQK